MTTMTRPKRRSITSGGKPITRPLPGAGLDPNIFPAAPGRDYEAIAETSWYTALMFAGDVAGDDLALADLAERASRCQAWFASHPQDDSQWRQAERRRNDIEASQAAVQTTRWFHVRGCWNACCEVYAALSLLLPLERQSWLLDHAPEMGTDSPFAVWGRVMGTEPTPGSWPGEAGEAYVERLGHVPVWERGVLKARVERKGMTL